MVLATVELESVDDDKLTWVVLRVDGSETVVDTIVLLVSVDRLEVDVTAFVLIEAVALLVSVDDGLEVLAGKVVLSGEEGNRDDELEDVDAVVTILSHSHSKFNILKTYLDTNTIPYIKLVNK